MREVDAEPREQGDGDPPRPRRSRHDSQHEGDGGKTLAARFVRLLRDAVFLVFGRSGQYVVTILTVPLVARALGPENSGLLAIGTSASFFGSIAVDLGAAQLMAAQVHGHGRLGRLRGSYFGVRLVILTCVVLVFVTCMLLDVPQPIWMASLGLLVGGLSSMGEEWVLLGRGQFGRVVTLQMSARVVYLAAILLVVPLAPYAWVPLCLLGFANALGSLLSWVTLRSEPAPLEFSRDVAAIIRPALPFTAARLISTTHGQGASLVYAAAISVTQLGYFSASDRLVRAVQAAFDAFSVAMLARLARRRGGASFWRAAVLGIMAILGVAAIGAAVVFFVAGPLIQLIYGPAFAPAASVLRAQIWLLPLAAANSYVYGSVLTVLRDGRGMLWGSVVGASITAGALALALGTGSLAVVVAGTIGSEAAAFAFLSGRLWRRWRSDRDLESNPSPAGDGPSDANQ